jgi:lipoprotein-releasing system ATP-binding protein
MSVIKADHLTRKIMDEEITTTLVENICCEIKMGEFIAITGPSGSGKSSLLYLLGLLDVPTSGDVLIDDQSTCQLDEDARARLRLENFGFVFQFHFLLPELTVLENVILPMRKIAKLEEKEMLVQGMEKLGSLDLANQAKKYPAQLSGGQRQRVAIARALANNPRFILADEPTGSLDSKNGQAVFQILRDLATQGRTVLVVTHDTHFAELADRHVKLVDGRLV